MPFADQVTPPEWRSRPSAPDTLYGLRDLHDGGGVDAANESRLLRPVGPAFPLSPPGSRPRPSAPDTLYGLRDLYARASLTAGMNPACSFLAARPSEDRPGAPERCTDGKSRIPEALCRRGKTKHPEHCTDERNHPSPPARPKKILYPLPQTLLFRRRRNNSRPVIGFGRTRSHSQG